MTETNAAAAAKAQQEASAAEETAKRERHVKKLELIRKIAIYKTRAEAIEQLIDEEQARLKMLMAEDGDRATTAQEGMGKFIPKRTFEVISTEALIKTFTKEQLAEMAKPTAEFVDACAKAKIETKGAIVVGVRDDFEVRRAQTLAARKQQEQIIEDTRRQMEATVDALAKRLSRNTKESR